jgi:molybdopterin synthase catalytic subunit
MIEITEKPISPELVVSKVKTDSSGCVVTYIGLIRNYSRGKPVLSVEYENVGGEAEKRLQEIAGEIEQKWPINNVAICHRIGKLKVGDINLVVAIAAAHRGEGFAACQYAIDQFKQKIPTLKKETYQDSSIKLFFPLYDVIG